MNVFVDFHHSSLLRSLVLLFEERLDMNLYRPIGMDWFEEGYWEVNNQVDTATQFLSTDQGYEPTDGTPALNNVDGYGDGVYVCADPGGLSFHKACTMDYFIHNQFDYIIASIPRHVPLYAALRDRYHPNAKLIVQMGNNWNISDYDGLNVMASLAPQPTNGANVLFYYQEFDTDLFYPVPVFGTKKIYSFINVIQNSEGWNDYLRLKELMEPKGFEFKAFGGQCPDGNMTGAHELAQKMREADLIFHVKPGGDGFGHILHNAYAIGRPVITRTSHYRNTLGNRLFTSNNSIDLDSIEVEEASKMIPALYDNQNIRSMGKNAADRFKMLVDYDHEAKKVEEWLKSL